MLAKLLVALVFSGSLAGAVAAAHADVVTDWNEAALDAIRARNTPPPAAARNLAMLHAAVYDAVNGIAARTSRTSSPPTRRTARRPKPRRRRPRTTCWPRSTRPTPPHSTRCALASSRRRAGRPRDNGAAWGAQVAASCSRRAPTTAARRRSTWPGADAPGVWRPTLSFGGLIRPALLPLWGQVRPFALESGAQFRPPAPPALGSRRYAARSTRSADARAPRQRGAHGRADADRAVLGLRPGHRDAAGPLEPDRADGRDAAAATRSRENARLFALLNIALADAAIVSWDCKYQFDALAADHGDPLADTDGNPRTTADPVVDAAAATPPFPEYTSGHSTFSGAAAAVLALVLRARPRRVRRDLRRPAGRHALVRGFWDAALESGMSRIYGGIHFRSANVQGLLTGARTGAYVARHYLRPKRRQHAL